MSNAHQYVHSRQYYSIVSSGRVSGEFLRSKWHLPPTVLAAKQAQACIAFPLEKRTAHVACGDTRSSQTTVRCSDNRNTHSRIDKAANFRVGLVPLFSQEKRQSL